MQSKRGRRRILIRRRRWEAMYQVEKTKNNQSKRKRKETVEEGEEEAIGGEEKVEAQEYRDVETAGLIREYQMNAKLTQATMEIFEFYGGEKWRIDEGAKMSRCIQCLVEQELVQNYQRDLTPDEETRNALEKAMGQIGEKTRG